MRKKAGKVIIGTTDKTGTNSALQIKVTVAARAQEGLEELSHTEGQELESSPTPLPFLGYLLSFSSCCGCLEICPQVF